MRSRTTSLLVVGLLATGLSIGMATAASAATQRDLAGTAGNMVGGVVDTASGAVGSALDTVSGVAGGLIGTVTGLLG